MISFHKVRKLLFGERQVYDTDDDFKEMAIWSANIQDPTHPFYNPFLLTN
tara:strand:+ start:591 stop:740 length:150 start_codon:yes stop_codon:yes gene_type:complete